MKKYLIISSYNRMQRSITCMDEPIYELHINKTAREKYDVDDALFESTGNVIFPNFKAVRDLAYAINKERDYLGHIDKQVRTGKLNAIGLIDEINHFLVKLYNVTENPNALSRAYLFLKKNLGETETDKILHTFASEFPPKAVYTERQTLDDYFASTIQGRPAKEIILEELIMLYLANLNPSFAIVKDLFDDSLLQKSTSYRILCNRLENFFEGEKPFGPDNEPLILALRKPMLMHPDNIEAQLGYYKEKWGIVLASKFLERIEKSFELTREEDIFIWHLYNHPHGTASHETHVPQYPSGVGNSGKRTINVRPEDYLYDEPERFTDDTIWMPNVVLLAKNIHVWLDQLSKKYQRSINRLDEIPDSELDQLAAWNFTGLWLIGVWERSHSSKMIKQINGNSDAVSSAYSLYNYEIAYNLGGEEAFQNLHHRTWQRGIRLAGDMVPNHMGLYSKWVIEHPEYFIQLDYPPYPNYKFTGPNLSEDPNIEIRIEDGYWEKSDAAVVFQRIDKRYGDVRYLYHGNDGTSMPWNDTAQLNLLRADVREAVIQSIFHVARKFSIIRFDAAMTLAKKHFQRLWYPMPGTTGVQSRGEFGMSRTEFDVMFPVEFWREVVDRFQTEMPHTLLLAEAFWMMEGYFVRTLGMHRVYNSAFMHMLMKEENGKFRAMIKNTLEYNPEILKRYVNFMSNPDEETAIAQFGKDDKYFGVATLMVTLPGLPMFAHGQIEGFTEKYGMEYQRAYYNETPDVWLVERHEREIFPLMKRRYLFSQVDNFQLYDFYDDRGFVNEDVLAYSNITGNDRVIVCFHNKFAEAYGWIRFAVPKAEGEGGEIRSVSVGEALFINGNNKIFYRFRDQRTSMEFILRGSQLYDQGFRAELRAFQYSVFMDFQEIFDETGEYEKIVNQLNGRGVANLDEVICLSRLQKLHHDILKFADALSDGDLSSVIEKYGDVFKRFGNHFKLDLDIPSIKEHFRQYFVNIKKHFAEDKKHGVKENESSILITILFYLVNDFQHHYPAAQNREAKRSIVTDLCMKKVLAEVFGKNHHDLSKVSNDIDLLETLAKHSNTLFVQPVLEGSFIDSLFADENTGKYLGFNYHEGILYFNKEQFERLFQWIGKLRTLRAEETLSGAKLKEETASIKNEIHTIYLAAEVSGYQVEKVKSKKLDLISEKGNEKGKKLKVKGNSGKALSKKVEIKGEKKNTLKDNTKTTLIKIKTDKRPKSQPKRKKKS